MVKYKRIFLGPECNNNCLPCQEKNGSTDPDLSDIKARISRRNSFDSVELYGGEPTVRGDFFEILNAAQNEGYKRIKIVTNARAFANMDTALRTAESGCYFFEIKVHHHEPAIHDYITQVSGSLQQTLQGIINLRTIDTLHDQPFNPFIHLRIPVSTQNYEHIGNVALALIPYEIDRITLSFDDSQIEMHEALPYIQAAINASIHVSEVFHPAAWDFEKSERCEDCVYNDVCPGITSGYFHKFGFHKLEPVLESRHADDIRRLRSEKG